MNVQALDTLINNVRNVDPAQFDMRRCDTCMLALLPVTRYLPCVSDAATYLDIPYRDSLNLFVYISATSENKVTLSDITKDEAVRVLEHYKATGIVNWSVVR